MQLYIKRWAIPQIRYDYTRTYALELCFHFVRNFEELKAIRFGILRSHIESKIRKDETPPHPVIKEVVEILGRKRLNNPKIPSMITTYFISKFTAENAEFAEKIRCPSRVRCPILVAVLAL